MFCYVSRALALVVCCACEIVDRGSWLLSRPVLAGRTAASLRVGIRKSIEMDAVENVSRKVRMPRLRPNGLVHPLQSQHLCSDSLLMKMQLDVTPLKPDGNYSSTETSKTIRSLY